MADDADRWHAPASGPLAAALASGAAELRAFDAEYAAWAGKSTYEADEARAELRPRMKAARAAQHQRERDAAALTEVETLVNALWPRWRVLDAGVRHQVAALLVAEDLPTRDQALHLWADDARLEELRRVLFAVTADPILARRYDALDALRRGWAAQEASRQKALDRGLNRGWLPTRELPAWAPQIARLTALATALDGGHKAVGA